MNKKTIKDIDLKGKKVLVRCDFNVPLDENKNITDNRRIVGALPTIKYLLEQNCKVILCSHLGRPKGKVNKKYSLEPVAKELEKLLKQPVVLANDIIGDSAKELTTNMKEKEIVLLENVRFDAREEKNDEEFSKQLASLAEVYVNDAFGTAHRAHSSTEGVSHHVDTSVAGLLIEKEVTELGKVIENPEKPFIAILGGAKVSDKIGVIENLLKKVDKIIVGGAMANTFLKAKGYDIGSSIYEADKLEEASRLMKEATDKNVEIVLPVDAYTAKLAEGTEFTVENLETAEHKEVTLYTQAELEQGKGESIEGLTILDIGEKTLKLYEEKLKGAKTICWNGPLGYSEAPSFANGTEKLANTIAETDAKCVIGGGDSVAAIKKVKKKAIENGKTEAEFNNIYLSTGGGASLEFLEGKDLPGISALENLSK